MELPRKGDDDLVNWIRELGVRREYAVYLKQSYKQQEELLDQLELKIKSIFEARGVSRMTVPGVGTVYTAVNPYPKTLDKDGLIAWLDEHGEGALAPRSVNFMQLRSWLKDRISSNEDLPPETMLDVQPRTEIRVRKG